MKRNRRADWRRIKGKTSYTFDEAARALNIHRNTVRHWVKTGGLPALTGSRPHLIWEATWCGSSGIGSKRRNRSADWASSIASDAESRAPLYLA